MNQQSATHVKLDAETVENLSPAELKAMFEKLLGIAEPTEQERKFDAAVDTSLARKREVLAEIKAVAGDGAQSYCEDVLELLSFGRVISPGITREESFEMMCRVFASADENSAKANGVDKLLAMSLRLRMKTLFDEVLKIADDAGIKK